MKPPIQKLCLMACLCIRSLGLAVDTGTITPSEFHQEIALQSHQWNGGELRARLREAAIQSQRLDLIAACFSNSDAKIVLIDKFKKLPASDFKTKVVIAMIRAPSDYWPPDREEGGVFGVSFLDPNMHILREPFASTIKELLPGKNLTTDLVRYQGRRNKLADELLAAYQKKGGQITKDELQAIQSMPLALNTAAEGGTEDPAYTRIPPTEMERIMKESFETPKWVPPVIKPKEPSPLPAASKTQAKKADGTNTDGTNKKQASHSTMLWLTTGTAIAVLLGWFVKSRKDG